MVHISASWCPRPAVRRPDGPLVIDDIAYGENERNADGCTSRDCMWPKSSDGKVYVPYVIASHYCKHWILQGFFHSCSISLGFIYVKNWKWLKAARKDAIFLMGTNVKSKSDSV